MKTIKIDVDVPDGYLLAPYPKGFLREHEKIFLRMPEEMDLIPDIDVVLTILGDSSAITEWKISHSSVKGCNHYLLGLANDYFYHEPNHNKTKYEIVSIRASNIRLYYPIRK